MSEPLKYIRIADDLHLEWQRDRSKHAELIPYDDLDSEAMLVLAGDIGAGTRLVEFIKTMSSRFRWVFYVPGNHEYYGCKSYTKQNDWLRSQLHPLPNGNVIVAAGETLEFHIGNVNFIGATLWTDCNQGNPDTMKAVEEGLNDFQSIPRWTTRRMMELHAEQKESITSRLKRSNLKNIVVTHHTPSHKLCSPRFAGHPANGGFHSNCDDILESEFAPYMWVFGHTHDKIQKYVGKTLCVNNPYGYPNEHSNYDYERRCFWDISEDVPRLV